MGGNLNQSAREIIDANLGAMTVVSDRADEIFTATADEIVSDLIYNVPPGDISKEYQDFRDQYRETYSRTYIGEESLNAPAGIRKEKYWRIHPVQQVIGPYQMDTARLVPRWERRPHDIVEELAMEAEAQARELERVWNTELVKMLVRGDDGLGFGGISPISTQPLFSAGLTQLRKPGAAPQSNLADVTIPGSVSAPTIADAHEIMEKALDKFLGFDAGRFTFFVNREAARGGMVVLTTSLAWNTAFDDLLTRDTLAVNSASAATERSNYTNRYRGRFKLHHLGSEVGTPYEGKIRIFMTGPRPEHRPVRFQNDLGVETFVLDGVRKTQIGNTWSYYMDGHLWETCLLVTPQDPP